MKAQKKVLLLVGSPRGERSTSASLGNCLISKLEKLGMLTETGFIHRLVNQSERIQNLFSMVNNADLIILTFPLYVDSLPAPVIKAMELIRDDRDRIEHFKSQDFIVICNCGFPEAEQTSLALEICQIFANESKLKWKVGIAFGEGEVIHGIPLQERGGIVRRVIEGFDILAESLIAGLEVPQQAIDLISKKLIPTGLYKTMGNLGWKRQAKKYGARKKLYDKPYFVS